jgi:hypothetical protein
MSLVHRGSPDYGRADSPGRNEYESHRWHTRGASPSRDDGEIQLYLALHANYFDEQNVGASENVPPLR